MGCVWPTSPGGHAAEKVQRGGEDSCCAGSLGSVCADTDHRQQPENQALEIAPLQGELAGCPTHSPLRASLPWVRAQTTPQSHERPVNYTAGRKEKVSCQAQYRAEPYSDTQGAAASGEAAPTPIQANACCLPRAPDLEFMGTATAPSRTPRVSPNTMVSSLPLLEALKPDMTGSRS